MNERIVKRYSLAQQVADQLQKMIEDGVWKIGEKIPTEPELTAMFSVSRTTLREAVRCLTTEGILVVKQGDGTYVRANNGFHARMSMAYDQVSLSNIQEARNMLELTVARLAARRRQENDIRELRRTLCLRQEKGTGADPQADLAFHMAIARASHNKILEELYGSLATYLESHIASRSMETTMGTSEIDEVHEALFRAILCQDEDQAVRCAQNILKI